MSAMARPIACGWIALGGPVVDIEPRVVEIPDERSPLVPRVSDGLAEQALRGRGAMVTLQPVRERGEDRPGPRLPPPHHVGVGELFARLLPFHLDVTLDGVQGADERQRLDRPR